MKSPTKSPAELLIPGRALTLAKGGATEWIHWQSGTAQLLPRLIAGRARGPLFLTGRKKEVIVTPEGLNVYPEDIERVLDQIPGVKEAAVIGPDRVKNRITWGHAECFSSHRMSK